MTVNAHQKQVYENIAWAASLATPADKIQVEQTPTYLKEPIQVADFMTAVVAATGASAVELGEVRGLPAQEISVDRRLATLSANNAGFHYLNGVMILGGEIMVPANAFYQTRDGKWMCFNGAYPHLRDGILKYFDAANDLEVMIGKVAQHDSAKIEADFEKLGLCTAPLLTQDQWLAHPQGQAMIDLPIVSAERFGNAKKRLLPEASHRPLEGARVIDVTHVVAGPWGTRVLADHGADVISVRNPLFPFLYPVIFEESYGKKQILLHLKMEKSKARFAELIKDAQHKLTRPGFFRQRRVSRSSGSRPRRLRPRCPPSRNTRRHSSTSCTGTWISRATSSIASPRITRSTISVFRCALQQLRAPSLRRHAHL
jgi:hypothetical protein